MDRCRGALHLWPWSQWRLGHGGAGIQLVPKLVEALVGKKVIGAAAGMAHTVVCTQAGELFTFGAKGGGSWATEENRQSLSLCRNWAQLVEVLAEA
jgi:alpha-tubulin suppressor-like RCC1 family protein